MGGFSSFVFSAEKCVHFHSKNVSSLEGNAIKCNAIRYFHTSCHYVFCFFFSNSLTQTKIPSFIILLEISF